MHLISFLYHSFFGVLSNFLRFASIKKV
jgi:hypothetical protein